MSITQSTYTLSKVPRPHFCVENDLRDCGGGEGGFESVSHKIITTTRFAQIFSTKTVTKLGKAIHSSKVQPWSLQKDTVEYICWALTWSRPTRPRMYFGVLLNCTITILKVRFEAMDLSEYVFQPKEKPHNTMQTRISSTRIYGCFIRKCFDHWKGTLYI